LACSLRSRRLKPSGASRSDASTLRPDSPTLFAATQEIREVEAKIRGVDAQVEKLDFYEDFEPASGHPTIPLSTVPRPSDPPAILGRKLGPVCLFT